MNRSIVVFSNKKTQMAKKIQLLIPYLYLLVFFAFSLHCEETLLLRNNLLKAEPGDYLVISSNKTETLMHVYEKNNNLITIEEIAVPQTLKKGSLNWKDWVAQNAPGHTSWVMYEIDSENGDMLRYYSFSKQNWYEIPEADNFLTKLLNLTFSKTPEKSRKRIGPKPISGPDWRPFWQPRLVVNGKLLSNVKFDAWRTKWPKDSSELSGKTIDIFLPQEHQGYPAYFPYWLQISGTIGKAKIRIIDSGKNLKSPKPSLSTLIMDATLSTTLSSPS